jgi:hypothetical protein
MTQEPHGTRGPKQQYVVSNFSGALSVGVLLEYLQLWDTLQDINLQSDTEDTHV